MLATFKFTGPDTLLDLYGTAGFVPGQEEVEAVATPVASAAASVASGVVAQATEVAAQVVDAEGKIAASLSMVQIVLFLAVVSGCVAVYLRMNRVPDVDEQKYSKIIA